MMDATNAIRTEIRNLELHLEGAELALSADGNEVIAPILLSADEADRLRLEMAKAQLWEWNQFEQLRWRSELRYRRYFGSWLVLCLAAFSAYIGHPDFYLPVFLVLISIFLWWRAGHEEQRAEQRAQTQRNEFRADWDYIRQRLEEHDAA
jgi:hypothetical protein